MSLVMLPVTAMCLLAGSVVMSHRSNAVAAESVDRGVAQLQHLVALNDALATLKADATFELRVVEFGVDRSIATAALGFDWGDQDAAARFAADGAIASLGQESPVDAAALRSLYAGIDRAAVSPTVAMHRFGEHQAATRAALTDSLTTLGEEADGAALRETLGSLQTAIGMIEITRAQAADMASLLFPAPGTTPGTTATVVARLGAERAEYAAAMVRIHRLGVASVVESLARIQAHPQVQHFERALAASLVPIVEAGIALGQAVNAGPLSERLSDGATSSKIASVATTYRDYFVRRDMLRSLVTTAAIAARDEAQGSAAREHKAYVAGTLGAAILALATIGVALRLGHSIARPLKDLASYAHAINDGQLDAEPSPKRQRAPREARIAVRALCDLVANLQLLDAKANALALCDFDAAALREPLPGRLGRSLESSVTLLSGSILERDELQTHLAYQATHDPLTGISNRPAAIASIQALINRAARTGATTAVLFIDLNEFKAVNDSHGHGAGDTVLREVAARLSGALRIGDSVARLGGDEFVVIAEGMTEVGDATDLARRLIEAISEPIDVGGARLIVGAAVGVAMSLDGPEEAVSLLGRADAAMYRAKQREGSAIEVFDAGLQQELLAREEIRVALGSALADPVTGGLELHYQPVVDACSGGMVGLEALIRWNRPGIGQTPPDSFIPIAERTSLIIDLDCWVLAEAARQHLEWSTTPELAEVPVAVNISGRHLVSQQLPGHIRAVLDATGIDPRCLSIEVTETVLLADLLSAAAELDEVRAMGVKVAIDDFGTGYTSLAHLQRLPIDTIKIDRSFISKLDERQGVALVRMVTDLGHAMQVNVVAEGVETGEEMSVLREMGADQLQGYLLCRPLGPTALSAWARGRPMTEPKQPAHAA